MIFEEHWARAQLAYPIIDLRQQSEATRERRDRHGFGSSVSKSENQITRILEA